MDRGLRAQLSPKEENALRKIAAGVTEQIPAVHLVQLVALQLIEERDGTWKLTAMGEVRTRRSMSIRIDPTSQPVT